MQAPKVNRLKRGVSLMEAVIAMAIIGVMITLAVSASVLGLKNQNNSTYRILAAGAAGEMYSAFSRTYYYDGFYGSSTYAAASDDERAEAFVNAFSSEVSAGLDLYKFSVTIADGAINGGSREVVMDTESYYVNTDSSDPDAYEEVVYKTRYITLTDGGDNYKFIYTYYYNTLDMDEDDLVYTENERFSVTAEVDLTSGYSARIYATVSGFTSYVFEQEAAYDA